MMISAGLLRSSHVHVACVLSALMGVGCVVAENPERDFGTYTGSAVEAPWDSDGGSGGTGANGGTGAASNTGGVSNGGVNNGGATGAASNGGNAASNNTGGNGGSGTTGAASGGVNDPTGTTGDPGTGGAPASGTLSFSVLTQENPNGRYRPKNIGAIWITDSAGKWVKTLAYWARTRARYLEGFDATGDTTRVDAVTSATLTSHVTHQVSWNSTDAAGNIVPDGQYNVVMEMTDSNSAGPTATVPFTKSATPVQLSPGDAPNFVQMSLSYQ